MNNVVILLASIMTFGIAALECSGTEGQILLFLAGLICVPAAIASGAGIILGENFFE